MLQYSNLCTFNEKAVLGERSDLPVLAAHTVQLCPLLHPLPARSRKRNADHSSREPAVPSEHQGSVNHHPLTGAGQHWRQAGQPAPTRVVPVPGTKVAQKESAGAVGFCAQINKHPILISAQLTFLIP